MKCDRLFVHLNLNEQMQADNKEVTILVHIVSGEGVTTDPGLDWPMPWNDKEVPSFLGLTSYYWHFVRNSATIAGHYIS